MISLAGRTVLITGASRGIGLGIARAFATAGADLFLLADDLSMTGIAEDLGARGFVADITQAEEVAQVIAELPPRLDVLVNNAGLERITPMYEPGDAVERTFARIIEINVVGTYYVTREALPLMGPGSSILITSSVWGRSAAAEFAGYVASKHANIGFMRVLAKELGPRGIRVNAVCPGWVRTRAALRSLHEVAARAEADEGAMLDDILSVQALPGLMEPADIASTYLFLASAHAANVTGQAWNVDRGELMA